MRNILSLACIELRFLGYPAHSLATILTALLYGRLFPCCFQCTCGQCMPILTESCGRESDTSVRFRRSRLIISAIIKKKPCRTQLVVDSVFIFIIILHDLYAMYLQLYSLPERGTQWRSRFRHCATSQKVAGWNFS